MEIIPNEEVVKMYNYRKICLECSFAKKFDSNSDIHSIGEYKFCPFCGAKLKTETYSPNF